MLYMIVLLVGPFAIGLPLYAWAARRYRDRREAEQAWDKHGPLQPTEPPPSNSALAQREWENAMIYRRPIEPLPEWRERFEQEPPSQ